MLCDKSTAIASAEMALMDEGDFTRSGFNQDIASISYWLQRPRNAIVEYLGADIDQP